MYREFNVIPQKRKGIKENGDGVSLDCLFAGFMLENKKLIPQIYNFNPYTSPMPYDYLATENEKKCLVKEVMTTYL